MKKYFIMTLAALLMAGCSDEIETEAPAATEEGRTVAIRATIADGAASRVALGESSGGENPTTPIHWETDDEFTLSKEDGTEIGTFKVSEISTDKTSATFVSTEDITEEAAAGTYEAVYWKQDYDFDYSKQAGTREKVGEYIRMTATAELAEGKGYEDLELTFSPQQPIIHVTLKNDAFKDNKEVTNVTLWTSREYISATETFTNADGQIEAWFVLSSYLDWNWDETNQTEYYTPINLDFKVFACCEGNYYEADLATGKTAETGKLYHVTREMKTASAQTAINMQLFYSDEETINITLNENVEITYSFNNTINAAIYVPIGKKVTINGGGHTISLPTDGTTDVDTYYIFAAVFCDLTLENVTIDSGSEGDDPKSLFVVESNVALNGVTANGGGIEVEGGTLTLNSGSTVSLIQSDSEIWVRNGGSVTFNGGTVSTASTDENAHHVHIDMRNVDKEDYIPLVCTQKPTAADGDALKLNVTIPDTESRSIATVNYDGATVNDFELIWLSLNIDETTKYGSLSLDNGTLTVVPPATTDTGGGE